MADYYSILKKTVSGLPRNTADNRQLVYQKARTTIDRQLRSLEPAHVEAAIAAQMSALETAIDRIEGELHAAAMGQGAEPRPEANEPALPPSAPAHRPARSAAETVPLQDSLHSGLTGGAQPPVPEPIDEQDYGGAESDDEMPSAASVPRKRRRSLTVMITLLVLAIVAGGGYALWLNKEPLLEALGLEGAVSPVPLNQTADTGIDPGAATGTNDGTIEKEEVRLGSDGETIDASEQTEPVAEDTNTGPTAAEPDVQIPEPEDDIEVSPVEEDTVAGGGDATTQLEPDIDDEAGDGTAIPAIGQKAYLYEEGLGNSAATRDNAAIVWSTAQEPPGEGLPPETVIKGLLEVPGRGLTMDLTIRRNLDESLSASHIIELLFTVPSDFSGGSIDTLARFVMKANEQARGEPLVAVPVKINSGFFMIALNNLQQARESNKRLLLESGWVDIPLGYTSGRRALVTLEKGAIGNRIFREAFEDWENR